MSKTTIVGYPRIGANRELKFAVEKYFKRETTSENLFSTAKELRRDYWNKQKESGLDIIPSNDFSYYDNLLDTAYLLNVIPKRYVQLNLEPIDTYFAMARGYQEAGRDVKALPMKKWFNTNYHYIVAEIDDETIFKLNDTKPFDLYDEAKAMGINTKPVIIGAFTFLKLANLNTKKNFENLLNELSEIYIEILNRFQDMGISYLQIDEPILVRDLGKNDIELFKKVYDKILDKDYSFKVILQTYFGDVRDIYNELKNTKFDAIGLDLIEGKKNLELIKENGFPKDKELIAGIVNGKNIWRNNYKNSLYILNDLLKCVADDKLIIGTSCSLLHVPYTIKNENQLLDQYKESMAFAEEKLEEIEEIKELLLNKDYEKDNAYLRNQEILHRTSKNSLCLNKEIRDKVKKLSKSDFKRKETFEERRHAQKEKYNLPLLPTTTIGSFPQTSEIKMARKGLREGTINNEEYNNIIKNMIKDIINFQEEIDVDVLVHGEYERNDMVEYFGKLLDGFLFTQNGWVQSYGTRGVKPPIIYGDVERKSPMTVKWSKFAQEQTNKPVKGMLTGPITILNWSFPREDLELKSIAYQIGIAIGKEVLDLEKNGINIIQIDEAALREKLPLRKSDWQKEYLDWAIPAFKLTNSKVKKETQIHTHMCYSEFTDIIGAIEDMDADVISIEAARSDFSLLDSLRECEFKLEIGPGVYDIHSPRIPTEKEILHLIEIMIGKLDIERLWVNPDCGLKTRGMKETKASLINMVKATKAIREKLNNN